MSVTRLPAPVLANQEFVPILARALHRVRALLPAEFGLVHEMPHDAPRLRADARQVEEVIVSAGLLAWQSIAGTPAQIVVEAAEVVMDEIVLSPDAETLQGGLPPRRYLQLVVSNSRRLQPGPLHMPVPPPADGSLPPSARRLKLIQMRDIVDAHKGMFSVSTDPSLGTAFDIYLPTASALDRQALSGGGGSVKHVVYVDDYEAMRELVSEILPDAGFRVTCFERGSEALKYLTSAGGDCDAVVSDYKLIDLNGIDLLKQLRKLRPELPVIIVSGYVDEVLNAKALEAGAAVVLSKSSDVEELCQALRTLLPADPESQRGSFTDWANL